MRTLSSLLPTHEQGTCLRKFREDDAERFFHDRSDPELARYQEWSAMSRESAQELVLEMIAVDGLIAGDWVQIAIADSSSNKLLGDLRLFLDADGIAAEIGFTLCREAQGQGHAVRAVRQALLLIFATSDAQAIRAITDTRNLASVRVLKRVGFIRMVKRQVFFKGEHCFEFVYLYRRAVA